MTISDVVNSVLCIIGFVVGLGVLGILMLMLIDYLQG